MRRRSRKAIKAYSIVVNINGDVGQIFTGDIEKVVTEIVGRAGKNFTKVDGRGRYFVFEKLQ